MEQATVQSTREASPDRQIAYPPRRRSACAACHTSKVKCSGGDPCARCTANGTKCVYKLASRIGKPKGSRNKSTLRRLQLEAERAAREEADGSSASVSTAASLISPQMQESIPEDMTTPWSADLNSVSSGSAPWNWLQDQEYWSMKEMPDIASYYSAILPASAGEQWVQQSLEVSSPHVYLSENQTISSPQQTDFDSLAFGEPYAHKITPAGAGLDHLTPVSDDPHAAPGTWPLARTSPSIYPEECASAGQPDILRGMWDEVSSSTAISNSYPCRCSEHLSQQIRQIEGPFIPQMGMSSMDLFMRNGDKLLAAISDFLICSVCAKEFSGLSLMAMAFGTFCKTLRSERNKLARQPSPLSLDSGESSNGMQTQSRPFKPTMTSTLNEMKLRKWREICSKAMQLLDNLKKDQEVLSLTTEGFLGLQECGGEKDSPTAAEPGEIEDVLAVILRIDSQLALFQLNDVQA